MGWKIPLCNWHTFWMPPCLICYFIAIFYIERKWLLMRNLARILSLKPKLSGNFQYFNVIDGSIKMLKKKLNLEELKLKWKIVKDFTRPKKRAASMKLFSLPPTQHPPDKILLRLFLRIYTEINGHWLWKCFRIAVLGVKKRWSANVFSDTKQKHVCWEILVNSERFWLYCKTILFSMWVEVRKMSEVFWAKMYCKISDLFR